VGPAGNPDALGAVLRPVRDGRPGVARALTAGGGYWSQPAAVQVLGGPLPQAVEVHWPGGGVTTTPVPAGARELRVTR
jgi:hypothetical protein